MLAALRKFGDTLRPPVVLWLFYEGNDLVIELPRESRSPLLMQYLVPGFDQNLANRQGPIDEALSAYADEQPIAASAEEHRKIARFSPAVGRDDIPSRAGPRLVRTRSRQGAGRRAWLGRPHGLRLSAVLEHRLPPDRVLGPDARGRARHRPPTRPYRWSISSPLSTRPPTGRPCSIIRARITALKAMPSPRAKSAMHWLRATGFDEPGTARASEFGDKSNIQ
jgi:hypothetical protein